MNRQARHIASRCLKTIERYSLIRRDDRILVGFSGGPDSTALLHILHHLQDKLGISLAALYLNHKLRPRAAAREAEFCRTFCEALDVLFFYEESDVPALAAERRQGVEETSREVRYGRLDEAAHRGGYTKIAVGHHRDDRAETILFNLFRGTGRQGLVGMRPIRDNLIRPLYDLNRDDILTYLELNQLQYMIDASNKSRKYTRNRIRHRILPLILKEISSAAIDNIIRFSDILSDEDAYLNRLVREIYRRLLLITPGRKFSLDLTDKLEYDIWLWRRLMLLLLSDVGLFEIEYEEIERTIDLIRSGKQNRLSLRSGFRAETAGDRLYLYRPGRKIERRAVSIPGRYRLDYPQLGINFEVVERPRRFDGGGNTAYIDADCLTGDLFIGRVRPGMKFHPYGRPGTKKVGDFLTDRKYPRPLRDELPVVCDGNGVVWVVGLEIDHRVRVQPATREIVKIGVEFYQS